jgi:single-strand DNA-binding protein
MAISVNKVILLGVVGQDPAIKTVPNIGEVATFNLMTMEHSNTATGEPQDHPESHLLMAYQTTAKIVRAYTKKGAWLYIEGQLSTRSWEDRQSGRKLQRTEITVTELVLISEPPQPKIAEPPKKLPVASTNGGNFRGNYGGSYQNVRQGNFTNGRGSYPPNRGPRPLRSGTDPK